MTRCGENVRQEQNLFSRSRSQFLVITPEINSFFFPDLLLFLTSHELIRSHVQKSVTLYIVLAGSA